MTATNWTTEGGRNDAARERAAAFMANSDSPTWGTDDEETER